MPLATATATATASTLMQKLPEISKALSKDYSAADSLIEYTRSTRNDFLTVVQDDLVALPYMPDIMQSVLSIVSGYFLSAVSLVVDVPGIEVIKTLDRLNANRDPVDTLLGQGASSIKMVGTESLEYGLPRHDISIEQFQQAICSQKIGLENYTVDDFGGSSLTDPTERARLQKEVDQLNNNYNRAKSDKERQEAMAKAQKNISDVQLEAAKKRNASDAEITELKKKIEQAKLDGIQKKDPSGSFGKVGLGRDTISTLKEVTNLSVGKVFNITFERDGNSLEIPVTMALAVTNTDQQSMFNIVTFNANNSSFKERYYRAKAGELSFIKDLILCQDMIEESRRQRIKDKSGFLENMMRRSRKNMVSGFFSRQTSINNASSVLIVSEEVIKKAALDIGGKFDKFAVREKVFNNTACMLIVVVDTKWETVRIYHRSLNNYTELSVRELKRSAKGGGADVEDILKAYSAGSAPVL